ncbi:MAG: TonB-dependent receptor [Oceanicaulis sp.]|uniref:TonB-dependent receptor domain-containing protein n=1 Tax=unclassified Oceanicaulis TaxID=2632123 RepID=UPI000C4FCD65|nr:MULTISPECIES: TonB-dependent receptor [unclassified Oceanicaulis]MBC38860.1 TonB-dependent receptor [Oceanicaulis sp.]MBG35913.1 TonB-dependent receptor [Oceanicaulis sp.]
MSYKNLKTWALASSLLAGLGAVSAPALAQEEGADAQQDIIQVTGTRIQRGNMTEATPVNTFNSEQFELSGAVNTAELLRTLPAVGVSSLTSTNSNFTVASSGVNTIELRNLTEDRTLVLMNGRRFVAGLPGTNNVDFNSIPTELIDRVDVVTGGASAVYGSDALAGVVNVILKDDFEGVVASTQAGISDEGDDETYRASLTMGSMFDQGRGNAVVSTTWSRENGVYARDREGLDRDGLSRAYFDPTVENWQEDVIPYYSSYSERGRILIPGLSAGGTPTNAANLVFDETTGQVRPFTSANPDGSALDGFNRQAYRAIAVPTERFTFSSLVNYEVNEKMNFFFEGTYASTETTSSLEPFALASDDVFGDNAAQFVDVDGDGVYDRSTNGISILNPYVPLAMRQAARDAADFDGDGIQDVADEDLVVGFVRRMTEVGQRASANTRQTARIVFGLEGDLTDNWSYEVSANLGRTTQSQRSSGQVNVLNLRQALNATTLNGEIVCADEIARAQGCVPVNIFGKGSISPEAAAYINAPSSRQAEITQQVYSGFLSGDLGFASPFAEENVQVVVGAEYRSEESESVPDALSQSGLNGGNVSPAVYGDFQVAELFAEAEIPLVQGRQYVEDLRLNLSARASDYTTVGQTFAWAANVQYTPIDMLRFRAQYSESVRAPNIGELFQPPSETFEGADDVCAGLTLSGSDPAFFNAADDATSGVDSSTVNSSLAQACFADPSVAARVDRDGFYIPTQGEIQGIAGFNGGNPNLSEETATSITLGAVFSPEFGNQWIDNFALSVDYYNIEIEDAIAGIARQTSVNQCYDNGTGAYNANSVFCSNIVRYNSGPSIGAIKELNALQQNLATIETAGIDVQASYFLGLNDVFTNSSWGLGDLNFTLTYGYLEKWEQQAFPGAEVIDYSDTAGLFEHEVLFSTVYRNGPLTVAYDMNWMPETRLEATGDLAEAMVPSATFQDVQVRWAFENQLELVFGVDNLTDEFIKYGQGFDSTGTGTDGAIYDAIGRRWYVGARKTF